MFDNNSYQIPLIALRSQYFLFLINFLIPFPSSFFYWAQSINLYDPNVNKVGNGLLSRIFILQSSIVS